MAAVIASRGRSAGSLPAYGSRTPIIRAEPRKAGQGRKPRCPDISGPPGGKPCRIQAVFGRKFTNIARCRPA